jgi:hypothetical protein
VNEGKAGRERCAFRGPDNRLPSARLLQFILLARKPNETPMVQVTAIIALSERLRKQSRKARNHGTIADLRLATLYLRTLAALKIVEEVETETDPERRAQLERELIQLYSPLILKHQHVRCVRSPKALN